jgi:colanic acid/amylovoran biosynthesis glycosyltransferase
VAERAPRSRAEHDRGPTTLRVAFVVDVFPVVSETFIIDQVAQLLDRGVEVEIFSFNRGDEANVSHQFFDYDMAHRVRYLEYPLGWVSRFLNALPRALALVRHPRTLLRALNVVRYGRTALALKLLYWSEPLVGREFDVVHCHFGTVAREFVWVREAVGIRAKLVTSFYGVDVSRVFRTESPGYYERLKRACSLYFVMSNDMRRRVVEHGFPEDQVQVHPVSVDVSSYPFRIRTLASDEDLRLVAVGRLVEKKGFDDLIRALAIARTGTPRITCTVVGGGPLEIELRRLVDSLALQETVRFTGLLPMEEVVEILDRGHVLVQPSKTAADGDME